MGRHLSPRYGQVILVSGYPVLTAVNWSQHWCAICVQYQSSCAPKLARKCEIEHWLPCGADGRSLGRSGGRCTVTWLPNFLGSGSLLHFLSHGALLRALRARELRYKCRFGPNEVYAGATAFCSQKGRKETAVFGWSNTWSNHTSDTIQLIRSV